MSKYKPYPKYKESGVEWLGEVPEHWEIHQLQHSVDGCINGIWGNEPNGKDDIVVIRVADFNRQNFSIDTNKLTNRAISKQERRNRLLKKGDLLLEKSGGGDNQLVGTVVRFDKELDAVTSNFVAKMTPLKNFNSQFLTYVFAHLYAGRVNYMSIKQNTGIQNLDSSQYLREYLSFPSKEEQATIANFLDHETAKIDTLIDKQQRLIELLKEKRQAVISHAVTKGLDPNVKMKDSGVAWLGEVPEHWEMSKLKFQGESIIGLTYSPNDITDESKGTLVLRSSNVQNGYIAFGDNVYVLTTISKKLRTQRGDILICSRNGSRALIGKNAMIDEASENLTFGAFMTVFRSDNNHFIYWILNSSIFKFQAGTFLTSTINQLTTGNLNNFEIPLPPEDEQEQIADYLDIQTTKIDTLIEKANQSITLLKERRTALISAAVTGKIDVRGDAA